METVITSDMPVSVSLCRLPGDKKYDPDHIFTYTGTFQAKHHVYLPTVQYNQDGKLHQYQMHDGIEIIYITDGRGILHLPDGELSMEQGDICFINPYELHGFSFDRECCERLCIVFFPRQLLNGIYPLPEAADALAAGKLQLQHRILHTDSVQPQVAACLQEILQNCRSDAACSLLELHCSMLHLRACLLNHKLYTAGSTAQSPVPSMIYRTIQYLDGHLYEEITSADAARHLGYTNAYFCRVFRKYFGTTFTSYVHNARIIAAKKILVQNPDILIADLSARLGFNNPNYFAILFRKKMGLSPSEFAKKCKVD